MCQNCAKTTAASFSPSMAITNPALIWSFQQEQKQRAALQRSNTTQPEVMPSSASTYSESTTYSYDKEKQGQSQPKRSMRQRMKDVVKDMGKPPTARYDSEHGIKTKDVGGSHGPMNSSPLNQQGRR
ncbi:hypothetical protein F4779DRAFT_614165 [Xylariaceae sp. FL0662B]|nr:hypothetical protein F4779DRAFT_614165 [Xylariaceae sp. FL0662B]